MLWFCFRVLPQLCPNNALAPVFKQDFGQGATSSSTSTAPAGTTNYNFGNVGTDGNYVLTPLFQNAGKAEWTKGGDHTGNTNGNMFLVNAGGGKSLFFKETVTGLCSGSTFNFSAWLANANTPNTIGVCGGGLVYANVIFNIKNTSGVLLATYNTGNLPLSPNNGPANWQQYGFQFTLPAGTTSLVLEMVDFWGGANACGNDLALDDILFTACTPQATISLNTSSSICSGSSTTISTSLINSPFTSPAYQWQKSIDNGVTWNNIGTPGPSANNFSLSNVSATDGAYYRVLVGPDVSSLSSNTCITASNAISLRVNTVPTVNISSNSPICSGNNLPLSATALGGTTPYSYTWSGPNGFSSSISAPSVPSVTTAATGTYSLTLTDAKGCTATSTTTVSINSTPVVAAINGGNGACIGSVLTLTDITPGGIWTSNNTAVAAITNAGLVTMLSAGSALISYSVTSNGCTQGVTKILTTASVRLQNDVIACNNGSIHFDQNPFTPVYSAALLSDTYLWSIQSNGGSFAYETGSSANAQFPYVQLSDGYAYSVAIQYTTNGITCSDTQLIYKNIIPSDTIQGIHDITFCNQATVINLSAKISAVTNTYAWSTNGTGTFSNPNLLTTNYSFSANDKAKNNITLYLTGSGNINTTGSCPASPAIDSIIIRILPNNTGTDTTQTICSNQALLYLPISSLPGSTFSWVSSINAGSVTGNTASGTGNIHDTLVNTSANTNAVVTYTITPYSQLPGGTYCAGIPFTLIITVNPVATISAISGTICSGASFSITPTNSINGTIPTGTSYTWLTPTGTGFTSGNSGAGNSITGTLLNTSNQLGLATYSISPLSGNCIGASFTITLAINPVNTISAITATTCSNTPFSVNPANSMNGIVIPGTLYTWPAPSLTSYLNGGLSGNSAATITGTLVNNSNTVQTATYSVTPVYGNCTASPFTLIVSINPVASITELTATICTGTDFAITPLEGIHGVIPAGTNYSWSSPSVTASVTGFSSSTMSTLISGTLFNQSNSLQTAIYTISPISGNCIGNTFSVTVNINPSASITSLTAVVCNGSSFTINPVNGIQGVIPAGTLYRWAVPAVSGTLTNGDSATNSAIISGSLINSNTTAQTATYMITPVSGNCTGTVFTLTVSVNPIAAINAMSNTICSEVAFSLSPSNGSNNGVPYGTLYSWGTPSVTEGLSGGLSGVNSTIITGLFTNPTNQSQTATFSITPISGSCNGSSFTLTVTVNPVASISPMSAVICNGAAFSIAPVNSINGNIPDQTLYSWSAPSITNGVSSGSGVSNATFIFDSLVNSTSTIQSVAYIITPVSGSCFGSPFTTTVYNNPVPAITSLSTTICSGTIFTISPANGVDGIIPNNTNYSWSAPSVKEGISGGMGATNAKSINGSLINTTNIPQTATYLVSAVYGNCISNTFTVTVTINPAPSISPLSLASCSGSVFAITPVNGVNGILPAGTLFSWNSPTPSNGVTGTSSALNNSVINGNLINTTSVSQTVTYMVTPVSNGCIGSIFSVTAFVHPLAKASVITSRLQGCSPFTVDSSIINPLVLSEMSYDWYTNEKYTGSGNRFPGILLSKDSAIIKLKATSLFNCGVDSTITIVKLFDSPQPSFTLSDTAGCGPLSVTITNATPQLAGFQYQWNLGNNQSSNLVQPGSISFPSSINRRDTTYTISLKAFQYCDTLTIQKQIIVTSKIKPAFTGTILNSCSPMKVIFTNQSASSQAQYQINYGDGIDSITGSTGSYLHIYHTGNQTVFLARILATNGCGTDSATFPITALPNQLKTDLTLADTAACGTPFTLVLHNQTNTSTQYKWDFGDGSSIQTTNTPGDISHTYQQSGSYLIANTINGVCSDSVINRKLKIYPSVKSVFNSLVNNNCIGIPIQLQNLSDSTLSFQWNLGDGSISSASTLTHSFSLPGNYSTQLKVWSTHPDITCSDSIQKTISIVSQKPGHVSISDTIGRCLPFTVSFTNMDTASSQTKWNWGDGSVGAGDTISHIFSTNGDYTVTMLAIQPGGCSYLDTAIVHINAPSIALQYKGGNFCGSNTMIAFTPVTTLTDSIRWNFGDGTILTSPVQKINHTYTTPGVYLPKLTLLSANHCAISVPAKDTIQIDSIKTGFTVAALNECSKTNYTFTDTSSSFFPITKRNWMVNTSLQPTAAGLMNQKSVQQVYTQAGNYEAGLTVENSIGCSATLSAKFNVQIYQYPQANINAINDACAYKLMEIKSIVNSQDSISKTYWNLGNGTTATDSVISIQYYSAGQYSLQLVVSTVNSCYDSAYKQLSIHSLPTISLPANNYVCKGNALELSATGAMSYIWKDQNDSMICSNCTSVSILPLKSTQYTVIGYNQYGCSNTISTSVHVIEPFKLTLKPADSICIGSNKLINVSGAATFEWLPAPGLSRYNSSSTYASPASTTVYHVIGKDALQCFADTASIKIVVGEPTPIHIGKDTTIPSGATIQLNTGVLPSDIVAWQWGGVAEFSCMNCASPEAKVVLDEPITCKATNQFGCITTDTINIKTFCSGSELFVPNAFTPDGDGVNDVLIVQGRGIKLIKSMKIFSRWGELVFEKTNFQTGDKSAGWDGRVRGKLSNTDVFVYLCEAVCDKGNSFVFKGNVAIIK